MGNVIKKTQNKSRRDSAASAAAAVDANGGVVVAAVDAAAFDQNCSHHHHTLGYHRKTAQNLFHWKRSKSLEFDNETYVVNSVQQFLSSIQQFDKEAAVLEAGKKDLNQVR